MGFPILVTCHFYIESRPRNIPVSASEGLRHLCEVNAFCACSTLLTALPTTYLCLLFDKAKGWEWGRVLCCYTCLNVIAMGGRIFRTSYVHVWGEKGIHSGEYQLETAKRVLCKGVSANMNVDILISWFVMVNVRVNIITEKRRGQVSIPYLLLLPPKPTLFYISHFQMHFCERKRVVWFKFHGSLFQRSILSITEHWFR